ncbi:MAG: GNAT family N-acetyltransferase [Nanoarchaeota archaeon]
MQNLTYTLLTEDDLTSAVKCVVETFLYDEPMTKNLGITAKEFEYFAKIICEKMIEEKLSYICKDGSNRVVGFCLNEDLITNPPSGIENVTTKMEPIFNILEKLDKLYLKCRAKERNIFFHMFMLGVLRESRGQGIAQKLVANSIKLAKSKSFSKIVTEATNINSQTLFTKKFNFKELHKTDYKKFENNRLKVFQNIGEKYCKLLELNIS